MTTPEILSTLKAIEDKLTRTPTAFNWTPAMSAIWPKDYRPTMSGLLAMWSALHEAAEYGETADPLFGYPGKYDDYYTSSPKPLADGRWIEWGGGERPDLHMHTRVHTRWDDGIVFEGEGDTVEFWNVRGGLNNWRHGNNKGQNIIAYRVIK